MTGPSPDTDPPVAAGERTPWGVIAVLLGPTLAFYFVFTVYPVLRTVANGFQHIRPRGHSDWIGWANYATLMHDATFWAAVRHTLLWATVAPVVETALGFGLACVLWLGTPFARVFRVAWFAPVLISYVVVAVLWLWLFNADWGFFNTALRPLGLEQDWLGNPSIALWSLMLVDVWKWTGFSMIVCLAALHGLPSEVIEASELDNCGPFAKAWFVAAPMIRPTLIGLLVLGFIGKMKVYDLVWIMTRGGPLWSTETVSTYVYKRAFAWSSFDLGYPSAIATVWFLVILAAVVVMLLVTRGNGDLEY